MQDNHCDKVILANNHGVKLIYCKHCHVVELELGAISVRLSPESIQQIANIMMKASLKLDHVIYHTKQITAQAANKPQQLH